MDLSPTKLHFLGRLKPPENAWHPKKDTKVVLITLPSPWLISDRDMPNLGLLYVASYLREKGVNVQVTDLCGLPEDRWFIPDADIYGVSCTTPQYPFAKIVVQKIKERQPDAYVVMGGYHPSAMATFTLEDSGCDCVVVGEGEYAMLEIVQGRRDPIVQGNRVEVLDTMPWPARDMIDIRDYQKIGTNAVVGTGAIREEYVLQSRGCAFTCLAGDTLVNTVHGMLPIKEIAENYEEIGVFTYDQKEKTALVSTARNIRITGRNKKLVRVLFDDGIHIDCTPDHKFLEFRLGNNQYTNEVSWERPTQAKDLKSGSRIRAISEMMAGPNRDSATICCGRRGEYKHRLIAEWLIGRRLIKGEVVHHIDGDHTNNEPDNLEVCSNQKEHMAKHPEVSERMRTKNPMSNKETAKRQKETFKKNYRDGKFTIVKSAETRKKMSDAAKRREAKLTTEQKKARSRKSAASTSMEKKVAYTKKGWETRRRNGTDKGKYVNHRVVSVTPLTGRHDVYCMEVPEIGWFFANNVLVKNCSYCAQMLMSGRKVRYRTPNCIKEEMTYLLNRYKVNRFYIFDDLFIIDKKRVEAFCDMVDDMWADGYKFDWHCLARADIGSLELYQRMVKSHCKQITYGLEHADNAILKRNLKECTAEQNMEAVVNAKKAGLRVRAQFIVGLPGETDETVETLAQFIKKCPADSMACHIFVPLPGSPVYTHPERFGWDWNKGTDYRHYQTIGKPGAWAAHMIHLNSDDVLKWVNYLKSVIANKNVFLHDARFQAVIPESDPVC